MSIFVMIVPGKKRCWRGFRQFHLWLGKNLFLFWIYCSKSSHSIEGRFQVAWIIDLQKWLFSLIMHEHILFTFNRKNIDSRPYHWRKGLCIYTKTVVTYVLTGPSLRFWKFRREIIFLLIKYLKFHKVFFLPNICSSKSSGATAPVLTRALIYLLRTRRCLNETLSWKNCSVKT